MIVTIPKIIFLIPSPQSKVTQLPTVAVPERRSSLFRRPPGYHHLGSIPKSAHTHIYTQTHTHDTHKHTQTHTHTHLFRRPPGYHHLPCGYHHLTGRYQKVQPHTVQVHPQKLLQTSPPQYGMAAKNIFKDFVLNSRPHPPQGFHEISI